MLHDVGSVKFQGADVDLVVNGFSLYGYCQDLRYSPLPANMRTVPQWNFSASSQAPHEQRPDALPAASGQPAEPGLDDGRPGAQDEKAEDVEKVSVGV